MPNLVLSRNEQPNDIQPQDFIQTVAQALYGNHQNQAVNCVGVMIQAGKTITSPQNWTRTAFGGHVSLFIIENNQLSSWDEIADNQNNCWLQTVNNDVLQHHASLMKSSNSNDVTCYMHHANAEQIAAVRQRAEDLANPNHHHNYSHWPRLGEDNTHGDCVSMTAWVMQAFSYSTKISGATTPWMESLKYEAYVNPLNFFSKWYKVKYEGRKLAVM